MSHMKLRLLIYRYYWPWQYKKMRADGIIFWRGIFRLKGFKYVESVDIEDGMAWPVPACWHIGGIS
jgi:hypothetical protein